MDKTDSTARCPLCGSTNVFRNDRGELVCGNCGFVLEEGYIEDGKDWVAYEQEDFEKKSRIGTPYTYMLHDKGMHTEISPQNIDFYNTPIPNIQRGTMYRLRKLQKRTVMYNSYGLINSLKEIGRMASVLNTQDNIKNDAAKICHKIYKSKITRGRKYTVVSAACMYLAYRENGIPVDIKRIFEVSNAPSLQQLRRAVNFYRGSFGLKGRILTFDDYINYYIRKLNVPDKVREDTLDIAEKVKASGLPSSGHGYKTVAATILYISLLRNGLYYRQTDFSSMCDITEISLRSIVKWLSQRLGMEFQVKKMI